MLTTVLSLVAAAAGWIAENSIRAGVVVVLILSLQYLGRGFMSARARSNLWLILLLHLVLPWAPTSTWSVHGLVPTSRSLAPRLNHLPSHLAANLVNLPGPDTSAVPDAGTSALEAPLVVAVWRLMAWCRWHPFAAVWLVGAIAIGIVTAREMIRDHRRLAGARRIERPDVLRLFEQCRQEIGLRRRVPLHESDWVPAPMVIGLWRCRVVMPAGLVDQLPHSDLRHIFLHEMAHLRRRDIPVATAMSSLLLLHWFNPLLWLAHYRLRVDRELACDAFVLRRNGGITPQAYGRTVIHLLEQCQRPAVFPNAAGILESKSEVKRRIIMIALHHHAPRWCAVASAAAGVLLAVFVLIRPVEGQPTVPAVTTTIAANGNYEDSIDLPFVYDDRVIGTWESVDFVADPADFKPGTRRTSFELYLKELVFHPDGSLNIPAKWTAGYVLNPEAKTASRYEVFTRDGQIFLSFEWKSGDYVIRHQQPKYYILRQMSAVPKPPPPRTVDDINIPFIDDPAVVGTWASVDFVKNPAEFVPGQPRWKGSLYMKELVFLPGGAMPIGALRWSSGVVLHAHDRTASHYEIRQMGGGTYMFYEWKSGDYTRRGMKPQYYVLRKEN